MPAEAACDSHALDRALMRALYPLQSPPQQPLELPEELRDLIPPLPQLRPAAVLVGLVDRGAGSRVILTRRTEGLAHHPGQVAFPGGRRDPGDTDLVATALREASEEIGLHLQHVRPLGYIDPLPTFTGFMVWPILARVASDHASRPEPGEVAEVFEVPLDFLLDPANRGVHEAALRGRLRRTWRFDYEGRCIWGATAAMLVNLTDRLSRSTSPADLG